MGAFGASRRVPGRSSRSLVGAVVGYKKIKVRTDVVKKSKLYRVLVPIVRPLVYIFYRLEVRGIENIPDQGRCIICPNHTSNIDPVLLAVTLKRQIYFMAKAELFKNKILNKLFRALGAFPVERGKGDGTAINEAENVLKSGEQLGLFIEGARSKTGDFLRPRSGCAMIAYQTNSPVVPVCITGAGEHKVKFLKKAIITIGKPISVDELNIKNETGKEFRDASRLIMENIKNLKV